MYRVVCPLIISILSTILYFPIIILIANYFESIKECPSDKEVSNLLTVACGCHFTISVITIIDAIYSIKKSQEILKTESLVFVSNGIFSFLSIIFFFIIVTGPYICSEQLLDAVIIFCCHTWFFLALWCTFTFYHCGQSHEYIALK